MRFRDRAHAGRLLADQIDIDGMVDPYVVALPRGGVPVGYEVARRFELELDVLVVRKIGLPGHAELAMGAIAENDVVVRNDDVIAAFGVTEAAFASVQAAERAQVARKAHAYRERIPRLDPAGRTVILTDDGVATGSTMLAALAALKSEGAAGEVVAVPVGAADTLGRIRRVAPVVAVLEPRRFSAVGEWYADFSQVPDEEVLELLAATRHPAGS